MILTNQMKDFKIYKTKMFLPTLENDKKKKSAILMMTPDYDSSNKLMNYPLFVNRKRYESYYLDRDVSYYIGSKNIEEIDESFSYLNETKRSNLSDNDFGIPEDRKYPLDTKQHVQSAIKLFGHAEESKKHKLARRIATKAKRYGIDIPNTTQVYKYLHEAVGDRLKLPKKCPYCGGIHVAIKMCGEPIFWCTDCDKPIGSVPEQFAESAALENNNDIDTYIFDIGGVLACDDGIYNKLVDAGIPEEEHKRFIKTFWDQHNERTSEADVDPEISLSVYLAAFDDDLWKEKAKSAYEIIINGNAPYAYTEDLLKRLKSEGKKLYYFSNWDQTSWDAAINNGNFDFLKLFDDGIVSWKAGYSKPSDEIYTAFKEKFKDIDLSKAVFFDDTPQNVSAARRNGFNAIIWNRLEGPNITEYKNNLLKESSADIPEITKRWGIISPDGAYNACCSVDGYDKPMRERASMIVFNSKGQIYGKMNDNGKEINLPGGGLNEREDPKDAAIRETKEEARIYVENVKYAGVLIEYDNQVQDWVKENIPEKDWWYGYYSHVYVGDYLDKYDGYIDYINKDDEMLQNGKWWNVDEALPYLAQEYRDIIEVEKSRYITEANNDPSYSMYIVSDTFLGDNKELKPSIPSDDLVKKGVKDNKVERVVFYPSINNAIIANNNINQDREMFVFVPVDDKVSHSSPNSTQVPDISNTREIWVKDPVKVKCIGKIRIGKELKEYTFEVNGTKYTEKSFNYSWLTRQDQNVITDKQEEEVKENYLVEDVLTEFDDVINTGDKLIFFNEDAKDARLKQMLYNSRMKTRKEQLLLYEKVKKDNPWIKYTYPELKRYQSKNLFVDTHFYTNLFFQNNTWTLKKGLGLYTEFMNRLINNPSIKDAGYTNKTIIFPVQDWDKLKSGQVWNFRESINPMAVVYQFLFTGDMNSIIKIFGNNNVFFVGRDKYFKVNFSAVNPKDAKKYAQKFKLFLIKLSKDEEFDSEDIDTSYDHVDSPEVKQAKIADDIEDAKGVDITPELAKARSRAKTGAAIAVATKNTVAIQKKETEKEIKAAAGTISKLQQNKSTKEKITDDQSNNNKDAIASDIVYATSTNTDIDASLDYLDNTDFKNMIMNLSDNNGDKVNISAGRAARMTELDKKFMETSVKGRTVRDILSDTSNKEVMTTDIPVSSPNEEWNAMSYMNFDKNYDIDKDILACFKHFESVSRPISIKKIEVEDNSTSEDRVELYRVQMEDYRGKQFTVRLDIPIMVDNRFLLRGNNKSIQTQFFNMPIIKTDLDTCQIISNYMKIFLRRFRASNGRSLPTTSRIFKALDKYKGSEIKVATGDNSKICNKYNLPIDYIDFATKYNSIETKDIKFIFNQDQLRKDYQIDDNIGIPYGVDKKTGDIMYLREDKNMSDIILSHLMFTDDRFSELFNSASRPSICTYSRASIMSSQIPLVVICGYHEGLRSTMDKAGIIYSIEGKTLPRDIRNDYTKDWIKFNDGYLVYTITYESSLLMNGLKECETNGHSIEEIDDRNMYLEFLDDFGGRIKADGLDNFYDLMVDPMIKESLEFYKMPTDYISILLYANSLLADNKFIKHTNTSSRKLRRYQLIAVYAYKVLADAYAQYANQVKHASNSAEFIVKQSAVIDKFLTDSITSDDSVINALRDAETTNTITTKGPSGMNEDRSYSLDKRTYDDSMLNIVAMSTGFAGNVGISRQATLNSNITPEGYVKPISGDTSKMNDANTLSATEALTPFGSTHDDPMRTAMTFVQSAKHGVRTVDSDPLLVTNGSDEALAYITTDRFAHKAKKKGTVVEATDEYIIIKYDDGKSDYINLVETIEKNSDGGYYVPLKLDAAKGIKVGSKVSEGQIVAYDKESFSNSLGESNNLAYNIGKIAKVAVINSDEGFEDSGIISESMAEKLATRVDYCYDVKLDKNAIIYQMAKIGDHLEAGQELLTWQNPFEDEDSNDLLKSFNQDEISELGKRKLLSNVTGTLKGIKIYRTAETSEMSNSLKKIVKEYEAPLIELEKKLKEHNISTYSIPAHYVLPATGKMKKSEDSVLIEFYVEYQDTVGIGDKVVYYSANKAVEKNIFPVGKEPYTDFRPNEKIDAFVSEISIDKRMVTSTLLYGSLQKLMIELDRSVKDIMGIDYDDSTV